MRVQSSSFSAGQTIPHKHAFSGMGCTGENVSPQVSWDDVPAGGKHPLLSSVVLGHTDFGANEYGGPCPPPGDPHHYHLTVYALDTEKLPLDKSTTGAKLEFMASQHTLARAETVGLYGR